jgi:hypothetical protein
VYNPQRDQMCGLLAVPLGTDPAAHERAGYVRATEVANTDVYDAW